MGLNFHIEVEEQSGNLHVRPKGDFDGSSACELINLLDEHHDTKGRVVIDTCQLCQIHPFGCSTFLNRLNDCRLPLNRMVFKGEKAHEIAPEKYLSRVAPKRNRCDGSCKNCPCTQKAHPKSSMSQRR